MSETAWIEADWPAPPGVRAITTRRFGAGVSKPPFDTFNLGVRNGDDVEGVAANRRELIDVLALPSAPRWLRQVHGTAVARFGRDDALELIGRDAASVDLSGRDSDADTAEPQADAATTATSGTVLAILTADCLPAVFAARDGAEIAAAHAGWRGLAGGVLEATAAAMHTSPEGLQVWLGPAAGPMAYEIGADVRAAFLAHNPAAEAAFSATRPGHWLIDLYALARQRLIAAGIAADAIYGGNRCTISEPEHFFSHRRDSQSGRIATLVWIA